MHDLGPLIWVILVIIGVISSIRSNAQKAQQAAQRQPPARTIQPPVAQPAQAVRIPQPLPQRQAVVQPAPPPAPAAPKPRPSPPAPAPTIPTRRPRGFFGDSRSIVRAVIAAEVLGRPKGDSGAEPW